MNNENENTNLCNFEGTKKRAKLRILGLDIIRSLAILFVIAGHFLSYILRFALLILKAYPCSYKQGLSFVSNGSSIVHHADRIPEYK